MKMKMKAATAAGVTATALALAASLGTVTPATAQASPARATGYYAKGPIKPMADTRLCLTGNAPRIHAEISLEPCLAQGQVHALQQWGTIVVGGAMFICMLSDPRLCWGPGPVDAVIKRGRYAAFYYGLSPSESANAGMILKGSPASSGPFQIKSSTFLTFLAPRLNSLSNHMPATFRPVLKSPNLRFFFWVFPHFTKVTT